MALGSALQVKGVLGRGEVSALTERTRQTGEGGVGSAEREREKVVVPSFFLCPISLELMRDPVTLSTGMTYDRVSIEKWLGFGNKTCPTTNQVLESDELIPNHTLRRLIQSWCVKNEAYGVECIPTPKALLEEDEVRGLLRAIVQWDGAALKQLWRLARECEHNRKCIAAADAVPVLASFIANLGLAMDIDVSAISHALAIVSQLRLSDGDKKALADMKIFSTFSRFMLLHGSSLLETKIHAADIVLALCEHDPRLKLPIGELPGIIKGLLKLLAEEDLHPRAITASLRCLNSLCLPRRNRVAALDNHAIPILMNLLPNTEKRNKELCFAFLEILASCAEGREAISDDHDAIPMIVNSLLGVSLRATEHAVATLWVVLSFASNRTVTITAMRSGAFGNLLMLLPVADCSQRAKVKTRDCLKLLNEVWNNSSCRRPGETFVSNPQLRMCTELM